MIANLAGMIGCGLLVGLALEQIIKKWKKRNVIKKFLIDQWKYLDLGDDLE